MSLKPQGQVLSRQNIDAASPRRYHAKMDALEFIGKSPALKQVFKVVEKVSKTDSTILITGESGTGKELIAKIIHRKSPRGSRPFVPVNCGAIPRELIESELFGHAKGAFTGAYFDRPGRFEIAKGGTLFLDEVGDLPLDLQVKLLRVLQEKTFERVGDPKPIKADVRIIAATNKNLEEEVSAGRFREDLYYRLNVVPIHIPPLRERKEDIPLLVEHFLSKMKKRGIQATGIEEGVIKAFMSYSWPGNVRELENVLERMAVLSEDGVLKEEDLPEKIKGEKTKPSKPWEIVQKIELPEEGVDLKKLLEALEEKLILQALERAGNVKEKAAKLLGLNRTTLVEKLKRKGLLEKR